MGGAGGEERSKLSWNASKGRFRTSLSPPGRFQLSKTSRLVIAACVFMIRYVSKGRRILVKRGPAAPLPLALPELVQVQTYDIDKYNVYISI